MAFSFGPPKATATTTQESAAPIFGQTTATSTSLSERTVPLSGAEPQFNEDGEHDEANVDDQQAAVARFLDISEKTVEKMEEGYRILEESARNVPQYQAAIQQLLPALEAVNRKSEEQQRHLKETENQLEKERDRSKSFNNEIKKLQEELETNLTQYERKIQKHQQELQAFNKKSEAQQKEMEAQLEKERDRSKSFKTNAGVLKSENKKLQEEKDEQEAKIEQLQADLKAFGEKNALHDQQGGVDKAHVQELEARARSSELGIVHLQKCIEIGKLRQARSNAGRNVGHCDLAIDRILGKQPIDRAQLNQWQTHKLGWENVVRDIQRIMLSQEQGYNRLVVDLNSGIPLAAMAPIPKPTLPKPPNLPKALIEKPQVQNVAKSTSSHKFIPPKPTVEQHPVQNGANADSTAANRIDLIFSALQNTSFPDLTREMVVAELLALKERSGGKLHNTHMTFKSTIEQMEQVLAAKMPRARPECVICHEEMGPKDLTECTVCRHKYHNRCVNEWLKKQKDCPMCRSLLLPDNDYPRLQ